MGIAASDYRAVQKITEAVRFLLRAFQIFRRVFSVEIQKIKLLQLLLRQLGDMPPRPEGMGRADLYRIFSEKFQKLSKREKPPGFLIRLQTMVQLRISSGVPSVRTCPPSAISVSIPAKTRSPLSSTRVSPSRRLFPIKYLYTSSN